MSLLTEGDLAPDIHLATETGEPFRLSSLRGRNVILYFYPKADTPGCTKEACSFRDESPRITAANTVVLGISPDKSQSQLRFKEKYGLPFTLLADTEHTAAEAYGVWGERSMYGKTYMGVDRATFVIDTEGRIKKIFSKVKVEGHTDAVLEALQQQPA